MDEVQRGLPAGPDGVTLACVQCALYPVTEPGGRTVLLVRGPGEHNPAQGVTVEAVAGGAGRASGPSMTSGA